jgi:hemin uptake protein HemP
MIIGKGKWGWESARAARLGRTGLGRERMSRGEEKQQSLMTAPASSRRIDIGTLLGSAREVILIHNNSEYRLRITSNDKLI